jgi:hypothetical protein
MFEYIIIAALAVVGYFVYSTYQEVKDIREFLDNLVDENVDDIVGYGGTSPDDDQ